MSAAAPSSTPSTIEWYGATTFRLRTHGLTIMLDTWVERPSNLESYAKLEDITECDWIFISHAHFDHLPGADVIAKRTGARCVVNGEAGCALEKAGVPPEQIIKIGGGETIDLGNGVVVRPWPALHCLMPFRDDHADTPDFMDTAKITKLMTKGFGGMRDAPPGTFEKMGNMDLVAMQKYLADPANVYSFYDGGQLMFNFELPGEGTLLFSSHLGGFESLLQSLKPRPDVAILGIAGQANDNGRPFQGSAAEYALMQTRWLGEPTKIIWCLHDRAPLKPYWIDTTAATKLVEERTRSRIATLDYVKPHRLFA